MKKQKENSHEGITWSEMGKQNVQAEKVYLKPQSTATGHLITPSHVILEDKYYQHYALWHIPTIKKNHFKHGENEESSET